jgi:hypothetical protein
MIWIKRRSEGFAVSSIAALEYDNAISPYLSVVMNRTSYTVTLLQYADVPTIKALEFIFPKTNILG